MGGELDKIKLIAINNGYRIKMVNKWIRNFINKMTTGDIGNKTDSEVNMKRVVTNYYPGFSEFIKTPLKAFGLSLIARPPPKLKTILSTKIDPGYKGDLSGVNIIPLKYYGCMIQRKFSIRCKEHVAELKYNRGRIRPYQDLVKNRISTSY